MYQLIKSQYQTNKSSWQKSFINGLSQDFQGFPLPWMTYPFIEFITSKLQPHHYIFEYGSGSSTLFFAQKVKKVVALESNKKWHEIMQNKLCEANIKNVELILIKDALENSDYENFAQNYCKKNSDIFFNKNIADKKFDLIIIDSLKRFACAQSCINALSQDGAIVLDDSERKNYKKIFDFFAKENFLQKDFFGIAPGQIRLKNTTFFYKNYSQNLDL